MWRPIVIALAARLLFSIPLTQDQVTPDPSSEPSRWHEQPSFGVTAEEIERAVEHIGPLIEREGRLRRVRATATLTALKPVLRQVGRSMFRSPEKLIQDQARLTSEVLRLERSLVDVIRIGDPDLALDAMLARVRLFQSLLKRLETVPIPEDLRIDTPPEHDAVVSVCGFRTGAIFEAATLADEQLLGLYVRLGRPSRLRAELEGPSAISSTFGPGGVDMTPLRVVSVLRDRMDDGSPPTPADSASARDAFDRVKRRMDRLHSHVPDGWDSARAMRCRDHHEARLDADLLDVAQAGDAALAVAALCERSSLGEITLRWLGLTPSVHSTRTSRRYAIDLADEFKVDGECVRRSRARLAALPSSMPTATGP